ncbi:MAG: pyrroline-5-carboxylate reductase family protein, partial [Thermoanaerobaculia bacterium]
MTNSKSISFIGAGNMAEAMVRGLLRTKLFAPDRITASAPREERRRELEQKFGIRTTLSNEDAASGAALVVLAVKPQDIEALLGEIGPVISDEQT